MKLFTIVFISALFAGNAFAKPKSLSDAFRKAINQSEVEKTQTKITLDIEKKSRASSWKDRGNSPYLVKVDSDIIAEAPVTVIHTRKAPKFDSSGEAERALARELNDLQ